jgi:hypothetical protein
MAGIAVARLRLLSSEGMIQVKIVEKRPEGYHIRVIALGLLLPIGLHFAPNENLAEAFAEIQPWLPTVLAPLDPLLACDNPAFVEVNEPGRQMRVVKSDSSLVVDVNDEEESAHVWAPLRAISSAVEELALRLLLRNAKLRQLLFRVRVANPSQAPAGEAIRMRHPSAESNTPLALAKRSQNRAVSKFPCRARSSPDARKDSQSRRHP